MEGRTCLPESLSPPFKSYFCFILLSTFFQSLNISFHSSNLFLLLHDGSSIPHSRVLTDTRLNYILLITIFPSVSNLAGFFPSIKGRWRLRIIFPLLPFIDWVFLSHSLFPFKGNFSLTLSPLSDRDSGSQESSTSNIRTCRFKGRRRKVGSIPRSSGKSRIDVHISTHWILARKAVIIPCWTREKVVRSPT